MEEVDISIKYSARLFVEFSLSSTSPPFLVETDTSNTVFCFVLMSFQLWMEK